MPCGLALNTIMFKMQMSQDMNDNKGQNDWGMYGEPNVNRLLRSVLTLTENVIGISIQFLNNSGTVKCNLAHV